MDYAIIRLGGKQYRVREGETLVVDRVSTDEGKTFTPDVLLGANGVTVTAKVIAHERGPKIVIGKYRRRTGYKRHTGFRAATTRLEFSLGGQKRAAATKAEAPAPRVKEPAPAAPTAAAPVAPVAPAADESVQGIPPGYEAMTVAQISEAAKTWERPALDAALAYERAHAARKGATAALESALRAKGEEA